MRVVRRKSERNITELARRIYRIDDSDDGAQLELATKALLRANPELMTTLVESETDIPIVAPNVEGLDMKPETEQDFQQELQAIAAPILMQIESLVSATQAASEQRTAQRKHAIDAIDDEQHAIKLAGRFGSLIAEDPERLKGIKTELEKEEEQDLATTKEALNLLSLVQSDLTKLR